MNNSLLSLCEGFISNRDKIKDTFGWENSYIYPVCASVFAEKGMTASAENLKYCENILKSNTGFFSSFRGHIRLIMISKLALSENPEEAMLKALNMYNILKRHFSDSNYLPVAAMIISELEPEERYDEIAVRTKHIYDLMRGNHPFLTSSEDSVMASLLALSDMSDEEAIDEMERCYNRLKPQFISADAVQSVSHVLALCEGDSEEKCRKVNNLYLALRNRRLKYGQQQELSILAVLSMLSDDTEAIVNDIAEVNGYLLQQKDYKGVFGFDTATRLMHAAMLVTSYYICGNPSLSAAASGTAIGSTVAIIVAQQAAVCACMMATTIAASSSSH